MEPTSMGGPNTIRPCPSRPDQFQTSRFENPARDQPIKLSKNHCRRPAPIREEHAAIPTPATRALAGSTLALMTPVPAWTLVLGHWAFITLSMRPPSHK